MGECCDRDGYQATFSGRFARRVARRYGRRGLTRTQQRLVEFLIEHGIDGATILEIGGGVGEIQVELLHRGAASVTNLEISTSYEHEASRLLERSGMTERAFVHPPQAMVAVLKAQGLTPRYRHHGLSWDVVGLER